MKYNELLKSRKKKIGVWGAGYIGISTMAYFAKNGIESVGYDIDQVKVNKINNGELPIEELRDWFGFDISDLVKKQLLRTTTNYKELISNDFIAHFVAIPTEKDGKPYFDILSETLKKICEYNKIVTDLTQIIIIESTLTPNTTEKIIIPLLKKEQIIVGKDILLSIAPRRDWFVEGSKSLRELDRVYGATNKETAKICHQILELVCNKLHAATDHRVAEMVKSIENSYRHMEITLANQLSLAFPDVNMREILRLVGTKWNIGTFYPGFGTGGYCIPLSSKYVIDGVKDKTKLSLLRETIKTDSEINVLIAKSFIKKNFKNIGVLGLSYKGNLKVGILSPVVPFVNEIKKNNINIKLFDPYFSSKEINEIASIETFKYPEELNQFDALVIAAKHSKFIIDGRKICNYLENCKYILDNFGIWQNLGLKEKGIEYHISGDENWLNL